MYKKDLIIFSISGKANSSCCLNRFHFPFYFLPNKFNLNMYRLPTSYQINGPRGYLASHNTLARTDLSFYGFILMIKIDGNWLH